MGGSWGGIQASLNLLSALPQDYKFPVLLVLHRMKNYESDLQMIFEKKINMRTVEVNDKDKVEPGILYIAPSNYHVLVEKDRTFSLDVSELVNFSRPSIDVTFTSAAKVFGAETVGILLSGANKDGSLGLKSIAEEGGITIVQDPEDAEVDIMPRSAMKVVPGIRVYNLKMIQQFLVSLE